MSRSLKEKSKKYIKYVFYIFLIIHIQSCKTYHLNFERRNIPRHDFDINTVGPAPNYSKKIYWAEHPKKKKHHAILPKNYTDSLYNTNPKIDVFYVHPTLYFQGDRWNADIHNEKLNKKVINSAIKYQASVFLGIAQIYAPHYRQMHIHSYKDLKNGYQAFDIAYSDVQNAFMHYWTTYNKSKRFIIAGHSQGTNHAERLLKEVILKNDSMKNLLIISYLPGMPIKQSHEECPPCSSSSQINCFLSWRTLAEGYIPIDWAVNDSISCVIPITWKTDTIISKKNWHQGILFKNHKIHYPKSITAYNHNSVLWVQPIKIPFARFYKMKNYHIADYNLFWLNIRNNLKYRLHVNGYN